MKGKLILENGAIFSGKVFGHIEEAVGEVVFNTGMTGYEEILTDPSYTGQIVIMTYPLIGNYGINFDHLESAFPKVKGFVVREKNLIPNHWRCEMDLDGFLKEYGVMAIEGIDTRALTKMIRNQGTMKGILSVGDLTPIEIKKKFNDFQNFNPVEQVTTKEVYNIPGEGKHIAILDFGVKKSIIKSLKEKNCSITVFPAFTKAEEILKVNPHGVLLSNGPGDPKKLPDIITNIKGLLGKKPMFGICLGHQLLALALGGDTEKLKFGHRGCNHPVKDLFSNKVYITSQNHGYVVKRDSLPNDVLITHISLNDQSIEGMRHKNLPIFSVQFHPEASPGPLENNYLFDQFLMMMEVGRVWQGITA
ncbi:carbamoyl-phosphate synthase small subunit [Anaerobranca californiensis DSM 14826]|jgi:carbamoyl-phosphate synthase small subunit|uniref:Carbamoyl phosphate synthase small chain n=1 Tax=Anaerobranca californiensis DSM 14826 TaxID=1120989 RepID=A0A1M6K6X5_9FIRM|nr:carbamoyl phosphate synthase small subunit [Anaerobranca californiensis]SHJ54637.1 carbamoyl-phosphate synthase small subunit [Anaerobranca californiensis DSM 14826]